MYEICDLRMGVRIRLNKEHTTTGASSAGGEHKQGSAVCWIQTTAPTTRPDGATALSVADLGRVWIDTTNNVMKALTAVGSPNTWTPIGQILLASYAGGSEPTRGLYMKGNELYFKGADAVEKLVGGLIDEDDMASDSATRCPSEQSVKAYGLTVQAAALAAAQTYTDDSFDATIIDEDDMASDSDAHVPTQQSVKAYVDSESAIQASGDTVFDATMTAANTWQDLDLSAIVGARVALVHLEIGASGSPNAVWMGKPKGYGSDTFSFPLSYNAPNCVSLTGTTQFGYVTLLTNSSGVIRHGAGNNTTNFVIKLVGWK